MNWIIVALDPNIKMAQINTGHRRITTKRTFEAWLTDDEFRMLNIAAALIGNWSIDGLVKFAAIEYAKLLIQSEVPPNERNKAL